MLLLTIILIFLPCLVISFSNEVYQSNIKDEHSFLQDETDSTSIVKLSSYTQCQQYSASCQLNLASTIIGQFNSSLVIPPNIPMYFYFTVSVSM